MLLHYRMLLPILTHASPILIHALAILKHRLSFRLSAPCIETLPTRLGNTLDSQSESIFTSPDSSANQNQEPINFVS